MKVLAWFPELQIDDWRDAIFQQDVVNADEIPPFWSVITRRTIARRLFVARPVARAVRGATNRTAFSQC
jgi:hypothetical protein